MATFDPNGKGRWLMEQLDQGAMSRAQIVAWASKAFTKGASKIPHVMGACQREGWVGYSKVSGYYLTDAGKRALSSLCRGDTLSTASTTAPNVRIFARAA